jgi:hypothetical protein
VIAVDGKTLRGSGRSGQHGRHLLAALDHGHGVVLGQADVDVKTNEIPRFCALLDRIEIKNAVMTAAALHASMPALNTCTSPACTPSSPPCSGAKFR